MRAALSDGTQEIFVPSGLDRCFSFTSSVASHCSLSYIRISMLSYLSLFMSVTLSGSKGSDCADCRPV